MRTLIVFLTFLGIQLSETYSQQENAEIVYRELDEFVVRRSSQDQYSVELKRLRRVYPMAIKAKAIMEEYEQNIENLSTKREIKRYSKKMNKFLKEEFTYSIRDLYVKEGALLIQLIHRETDKTVDDILSLYATSGQKLKYKAMAKIFGHDLKATYDMHTSNKMTELVIGDILSGKVDFNHQMQTLEKATFKKMQKEYRIKRKEYKKQTKKIES